MNVVTVKAIALCFLFVNRNAIRPKNTTAIVAWPLGIANVASGINAFAGLILPNISFNTLIRTPVARIVAAKNIPFFFETLR